MTEAEVIGEVVAEETRNLPAVRGVGERFWSKVDRSGECWLWTSSLRADGYGRFWLNGKNQSAHRLAYEAFNGAIPAGMTLDHLCRVHACVNPAHLEPVTSAENIRRGEGVAARNATKTHCKHGHELTPENTYTQASGSRGCRECRRDYNRTYGLARRSAE